MPPIDVQFVDVSGWGDWLLGNGLRILIIVVIALVASQLAVVAIQRLIPAALGRTQRGDPLEAKKRIETVTSVLAQTTIVTILILAAITILPELGIQVGPLIAGAGVVGVALAFGAQSLVKDLLAGLFILWEGQYFKGDVIMVAGVSGVVEDINWRRTLLRDVDGTLHIVPNGLIEVASNLTAEVSKVNFDVQVAYATDLDQAIGVINEIGTGLAADPDFGPLIIEAPQVLRVDGFSDTGVVVKVLGTTRPGAQWRVGGEMRLRIKKAFDAQGLRLA